jgi:head-tail adaptor
MNLLTETVILMDREVVGTDTYGNDVVDWVQATSPAWLEQRNGQETTGAGEQSVANMLLWLPGDLLVEAVDKVVWRGSEWEVAGAPGWQPPGATIDAYQVMALRKVTG